MKTEALADANRMQGSGTSPIDNLRPATGYCCSVAKGWDMGARVQCSLTEKDKSHRTRKRGAIRHIMQGKVTELSRNYASALRKHLEQGPHASLRSARGLGRQAASLGLETLDVAKIHEGALANMEVFSSRHGSTQQAEIFLAEAIMPIEKTHEPALQHKTHSLQVNKTLDQRMVDLETSNRSLKESIARQKSAEEALKKSARNAKKRLDESHHLQEHLQHLAHQVISAQEEKRIEISHDLQNEIAQTLVAINVRLISLKQEAAGDAKGLKKSIVATQRLVEESVEFINRFARGLAVPGSG